MIDVGGIEILVVCLDAAACLPRFRHGFERSSGLLKWWLWGKERERLEESLLSKIEQEKEEEGEEGEGDLWWIERNDDRGQDSRILGERQRGTHRFDE